MSHPSSQNHVEAPHKQKALSGLCELAFSTFTEELDYETTLAILLDLAGYHAEKSGPFAADLLAKVAAGDAVGLAGHSIDHSSGSPDELYHARQCRGFFEKLEALEAGIDREAVAWEKFIATERSCAQVNKTLRASRVSGFHNLMGPEVQTVLSLAVRNIAECLGDVPTPEQLKPSFGPGANTSVKARASSARWKLDAPLTCSSKLLPALHRWVDSIDPWLSLHGTPIAPAEVEPDAAVWESVPWDLSPDGIMSELRKYYEEFGYYNIPNVPDKVSLSSWQDQLRHGKTWREQEALRRRSRENYVVDIKVDNGRLQFVPKSYKTHRSIIVEPLINSFLQKGVGKYLKARLRRVGVDLADQSRNKRLARASSFYDHLATVDLSSASDTISKELVYELLPLEWASLLDELRTATVEYKGQVITLEKWSSMGNAYTFELESLIFWGLSKACCQYLRIDTTDLAVYGDDIILPVNAVGLLKTVFDAIGFSFNEEKSFVSGQFRESCGGDYVLGIDIRPYYQKHLVSLRTLFSLHNYYINSFRFGEAAYVARMVPEDMKIWGPAGYGDGHLIGSWTGRKPDPRETLTARELQEYRRSPTKWSSERFNAHGWEGVLFETFVLKPKKLKKRLKLGDKLLPAYSIYVTGQDNSQPALTPAQEPSDHTVVRGWKGYRRMSIYTLSRYVFARDTD